MTIFRNINTSISKVDRLLYLVNSTYFFAIGKNTAWNNSWGADVSEENPPSLEETITSIPDIKLYKQPIYKTLATKSQCEGIQFESCGEVIGNQELTLINLQTTNRETLEAISPDYLYFRILIEESDLTFANIENFRVAGLFKNVTFTNPGQIRYLPTSVVNQGSLYWASYFTPIFKSNILAKTSIFQLLLKL
jgi:hypothetical protein